MKIPKLQIGTITAEIPIIQGAMGVRVSLSSLASAVANEGGIGTIASVGLGDIEASKYEYERMSREALAFEIRKAKSLTNGHIAVNVMGVLSNADDLVRTAVNEGIKIIVSGASLPLKLPSLVEDNSVNLLPIVSSGRAAELVLRAWHKRYGRTADGIILEGPLAGGHLGFSLEQLQQIEKFPLKNLLLDVLEAIKAYEDKYGKKIPVIAAGGIFDGRDIAEMLLAGASGVQIATRFVCTLECDVSQEFKQTYLDAKEEDIVIIKSPVGLPGRAIRNKFLTELETKEKLEIKCPYRCLSTCNVLEAKYCIAQALVNAYLGNIDHGLIFCGQNAYRINKIVTVKELISELLAEIEAY
jgi:NAD(P)H-dependent flavin oxidoreductase YrpB (nitropropane dioxygenase family)